MEYWDSYFREQRKQVVHDYDGWLAPYEPVLQRGKRALDLGCGSGVNTGALLSFSMQVTAADFSPNAVETVKRCFPKADTACFDMTRQFPFEAQMFDAVIADLSLHYFSQQDTQRIIDEIRRVLRPQGVLLARVHALSGIDTQGLEEIEPHYYVSNGYSRRYFTGSEIEMLFSSWTLKKLEEKDIVRFGLEKRVFEIAAVRDRI